MADEPAATPTEPPAHRGSARAAWSRRTAAAEARDAEASADPAAAPGAPPPGRTGWRHRFGSVAVKVLGGVMMLLGVVLLAGGLWLIVVGGSPYYALAGLGLLVSGWLLIRLRLLGVWAYAGVFAATVAWALWEVGLDGWPLVPRLVGPAVLMVLVCLALPVLAPPAHRRPLGYGLAGATAAVLLVLGIGVYISSRPAPALPLPRGAVAAMADPSALPVGADWPSYGGTQAARRFTPLAQLTPANVDQLERLWVARTGDLPAPGEQNKYGNQNTPLKVGRTLYMCSATNDILALDAATGALIWRVDPGVDKSWIPYTAACRGVVYHQSATAAAAAPAPAAPGATDSAAATPAAAALCASRIIVGTLDARLIAVDARTGRRCTGFGDNGQVDIKQGMGPVAPGMVSITSPPVIVRGNIITGHQVLDGQERMAPSGVIQAFDVETGRLAWAWDMMQPARTGAPPPGEIYTLGTPNMWTMATGDEALGLVYLPMGNAAADYWSSSRRPAEKQYSTALVALDATTGRPRWHFQTVRNDVWDYDLGSQVSLIDWPTGGTGTPALVLPSKQGEIYILDRRTGAPLTPVIERPAPRGGVEPEQRAPMQPYSGYHSLAMPALTERAMWGMSPIDQMICRIQFRQAHYEGIYTPPTSERRWVQYPGYNGGSDWGSVAVDPLRGVLVANYNDMPNHNRLIPRAKANEEGWLPRRLDPGGESLVRGGTLGGAERSVDPQLGTPFAIDVNAGWRLGLTNLLCKQPPYGGIRAIELATGRTLWDRPLGTARRNGPWGIPSGLPLTIGTPNNGGPLMTGGGLVFIAAATDDLIRAYDLRTGKVVWQDALPAGGQATPMSYQIDGRQVVVIMAGGHHFMETRVGDYIIAYALPRRP